MRCDVLDHLVMKTYHMINSIWKSQAQSTNAEHQTGKLLVPFLCRLKKATYRDHFVGGGGGGGVTLSCPGHNFRTVTYNDSRFGMNVSDDDAECSAQEP